MDDTNRGDTNRRDANRRASSDDARFVGDVEVSARRKLKARRIGPPVVWSGLGTMGAVGWSIVVPTLLGAVLGIWLDKHHPIAHSWSLSLLVAGLVLGCFSAWHWVSGEEKAMRDEQAGGDD